MDDMQSQLEELQRKNAELEAELKKAKEDIVHLTQGNLMGKGLKACADMEFFPKI